MEIKSDICFPCPIPANASMSVVIGEEPGQGDEAAKKNIGFKFFEEYDRGTRVNKPMKLKSIAGHDGWQDGGEMQPETPLPSIKINDFVELFNGKIRYSKNNGHQGSLAITGILQDLITDLKPAYDMEITLNWKFTKKS